jgi:hypothetical protein
MNGNSAVITQQRESGAAKCGNPLSKSLGPKKNHAPVKPSARLILPIKYQFSREPGDCLLSFLRRNG